MEERQLVYLQLSKELIKKIDILVKLGYFHGRRNAIRNLLMNAVKNFFSNEIREELLEAIEQNELHEDEIQLVKNELFDSSSETIKRMVINHERIFSQKGNPSNHSNKNRRS